MIFHADNTFEQIDRLVALITEWAELMLQRERLGAEPLMAATEGVNLDWLTKVVTTSSSTMDEGLLYAKEVEVA